MLTIIASGQKKQIEQSDQKINIRKVLTLTLMWHKPIAIDVKCATIHIKILPLGFLDLSIQETLHFQGLATAVVLHFFVL